MTDELGRTTDYAYDRLDRLITETSPDPDGASALARPVTSYTYNLLGQIKTLTQRDNSAAAVADPTYGNTTTWEYDTLGRTRWETNELGHTRYFNYDLNGNLTQSTDRKGRVTEYKYDRIGRQTAENWMNGASIERSISYKYDDNNRLTDVTDPAASFHYQYDVLGRMTDETFDTAGAAIPVLSLHSDYDDQGRRTTLKATIGTALDFVNAYSYDEADRLTRIVQQGQGGNAVALKNVKFGYNLDNTLASISRYADANSTKGVAYTAFEYDGQRRLTHISHTKAGNNLVDYQIRYEDGGDTAYANGGKHDRIEQIVETYANSQWSTTHNYTYDNLDQLTGATHSAGQSNESYGYDENGNRTSVTHLGASTATSVAVSANNRTTNDGTYSYSYDEEGNRTSRTWIQNPADPRYNTKEVYGWDYRNRLTSVTFQDANGNVLKVVSYEYDYLNRMVHKTVTSGGNAIDSYFAHDDNQVILQWDEDGSGNQQLSHRYLWGPMVDQLLVDEQISPTTGAGKNYWALTDHVGTVKDLATYDAASGTTTIDDHRTFDSFGNLTSDSSTLVQSSFAFTGKYSDSDTGLQWNLHRWYDPQLGQWISEDPIGFAGDPSNLYRYVGNHPTYATDPTGLDEAYYEGYWTEVGAVFEGYGRAVQSFGQWLDPRNRISEIRQQASAIWNDPQGFFEEDTRAMQRWVNTPTEMAAERGTVICNAVKEKLSTNAGVGEVLASYAMYRVGRKSHQTLGPLASESGIVTLGRPNWTFNTKGRVTGYREILPKVRAARGGDISALGEIEAAKVLRRMGRNVHFQTPTGSRGPNTADFLIDGRPYDVFTPTTSNPGNVIKGIFNKQNQAPNIILNMRHTPVTAGELGDVLYRVNSFHPDFPGRIQCVEIIP